jgi:tripartite-type tricarboxylate transporter receptor subunit TctC
LIRLKQYPKNAAELREKVMRLLASLAFICFSALVAAPADAEDAYPNRAIHVIVPFPAGGPSDVLARLVGDRMSADFGQAVVVENRPGANTVIGAEAAAKASPDGYTLLMAIDSTLVMNQFLYKALPYDPIADFAPITLVGKTIGLIVVNAQSDLKSMKDLIAKAKSAPGKLNYGAGTISTKLQGYLLNDAAGIDTVLVPYNGSSEVAHGVLTKSVDFGIDGPSAELPLIQSGDLRALAKLDRRPFPALPDLPTLDDAAGLHLGDLSVWLGLVAPHGTPAQIVDKLQNETAKILNDPTIKARADAVGLFPSPSTPAEFAAYIHSEVARWEPVVKKSGLHFD